MVQKKMGRKRSKSQLTTGQQNRILQLTVALVFLALLWIIFTPQTGVYGFLKQKEQLERLQLKTVDLQVKNDALRKEIDLLKNDPKYLEKIAREKYGLMKKNERVYFFGEKTPGKKQ